MSREEFREFLRKNLEETGLSIRELGRRSGVNHSYIAKILNGDKKNPPSAKIISALSEHLPCSQLALLEKADYLNTDQVFRKTEEKQVANSLFEQGRTIYNDQPNNAIPIIPSKEVEKIKRFIDNEHCITNRYKKLPRSQVTHDDYYLFIEMQDNNYRNFGIYANDLILIDFEAQIQHEDTVVVIYANEILLAKFYRKYNLTIYQLFDFNIILQKEDIQEIGKAISLTRKF